MHASKSLFQAVYNVVTSKHGSPLSRGILVEAKYVE
jgi:hypothetical protein